MISLRRSAPTHPAFGPAVLCMALVAMAACSESQPTPSASGVGGAAPSPADNPGEGGGDVVQPGEDGAGDPGAGDDEGAGGPADDGEPGDGPGGDPANPGGGGDVEPGGGGVDTRCPDGSARPLNGDCPDLVVPAAMVVHSVAPAAGPVEGGTEVTILGTGFNRPITVFVAGQEVEIDPWRNNEELRFPTPSVKELDILGSVDVELVNGAGNLVLAGAFNYYDQIRLESLSHTSGSTNGGDRIRVIGAGFDDSLILTFGQRTGADIVVHGPNAAEVTTPKGEPGVVDVAAFTNTGQARLDDAFTYIPAVELTAVSPNFGPLEGGTIISLTGAGFAIDSTVRIGPIDATVLGVSADGGTLTASTPRSGEAGARDVRVIAEGGEAVLLGAFSYFDPADSQLRLFSVVPPTGSTRGGENVDVIGANFDQTTEVSFGINLAECQLRDDHSLRCTTPAAAGPGLVDLVAEGRRGRATLPAGFQYRAPLEITMVAPASGPEAGGTRLTVRGAGFDADTTLRVGVSDAVGVQVLDPTTLIATTPPGSSGPADITVRRADGAVAVAEGAFQYTAGLRLLAVAPAEGAMAGGTTVSLLGSGFVPGSRLTFGGAPATEIEVAHGASLTALTPAGQPGKVDVVLTTPNGEQATLEDGFTYFNPATLYGGTWGENIEGSVNITVLNAGTGGPIQGAFCMLGTERGGDYEGVTDQRGQITFSGDDVFGRQMITCGAEGYSNASVVRFDAENVSVYLFPPPPPPSPGPMGPGPAPATVSGLVWGIDKYLKPQADPENGWEAVAFVQTTTEHMYADRRPDPGEGWIVFDDGPYEIRARLGDLAAVAIGGIRNRNTGEFRPIRMGAARWLFGISGERIEGANIELNIPMENVAGLRFDSPPVNIDGPPDWMVVEPTILFDADGAYPLWQYINVTGEPIEAGLELHRMPALVNAFEDTSLTFRVEFGDCDGCREDPRSIASPYTETFVREVESLADEIDITPILGIPRLVSPAPGGSPAAAPSIVDNTIEWDIHGGSDLPTGQNHVLFRFNAQGEAIAFWDMYFRGDETSMVLPAIDEVHGVQPDELLAILFIATYVDGFDLDNFEYGDFGIDNRRAQSLSVGWLRY